jgi:hypothetical protein
VNAQLSGDGADFPMLGVEVTTDLNTGFWTHHLVVILIAGAPG